MQLGIGHQLRKLASGRQERQVAAVRSLGRSHNPRALRPLFDFLAQDGGSLPAKVAAAEALTAYRDSKSLEFFLNNLGGPDDRRVAAAADVLAAIKYRDAIAPLLRLLSEGRASWQVTRALVELEAFEPLGDLLHSGHLDPTSTRHLLAALKDSGDTSCIELVLPLLQSPDFGLRRMAAEAIGAVDGNAARQGLMRILPELDFEGLLLCVPVLKLTEQEWMGSVLRPYYQIYRAFFDPSYPLDSGCTEKLLAILLSGHESVRGRAFAARRLGRNPDSRAVAALREIMRSGVAGVWREAARALRQLPDVAATAEADLDRLLLAVDVRELSELDATAKAAIPSLPSTVVENLFEEDPGGAAGVVQKLEQNGWKPRTLGENAVYHILRKEWGLVTATGEACIAPLVEAAATDSDCFDDDTRREAARALEAAVEHLLSTLPEITLSYLCALSNPARVQEEVGAEIRMTIYSWENMRRCIRRELERRNSG